MHAQPVIGFHNIFSKIKKYRVTLGIDVLASDDLKVSELPEDVLIGWFAHELGHIVDYLPYSVWGMIVYGLKYTFLPKYKRDAEHRADIIAVNFGFRQEILATKRFILKSGLLKDYYVKSIEKYYMSEADVEEILLDKVYIHPDEKHQKLN